MTATVWQRNDHWVGTQIDDSFVMLDFEGGTYVSLNVTATDVWNALEDPSSAEKITGIMTERYEVSNEECAAAVDRVLADFEAKRLIQPVA